ncbi:MAG: glycosyl hydrolase [Bacteroidales bacterium]|nr:glycosyl hydrolase [Bacteroidales bacterium]
MKQFIFSLILLTVVVAGCNQQRNSAPEKEKVSAKPANPKATPEAVKLLTFLHDIKGNHTVAGQHNYPYELSRCTDSTFHYTSKTPLLWGSDFTWMGTNAKRDSMVEEAIKRYNDGYIVTLMWHANPPLKERSDSKKFHAWYKMPEEEWLEILTPGSEMNQIWLNDVDAVAIQLKKLQAANIPVLFRPYHEMNGAWFWWGNRRGENGFTKLWKMIYDRMVNYHGLNNILWVWNANAPRDWENDEAYDYELFYPGDDYVDVLAADVYKNDYKQSHHDQLAALGKNKIIALGEVGEAPTPEILRQQPEWVWFMVWAHFNWLANSPETLTTLHNDSCVITKENLKDTGLNFK